VGNEPIPVFLSTLDVTAAFPALESLVPLRHTSVEIFKVLVIGMFLLNNVQGK
jgi:hypothetical protein